MGVSQYVMNYNHSSEAIQQFLFARHKDVMLQKSVKVHDNSNYLLNSLCQKGVRRNIREGKCILCVQAHEFMLHNNKKINIIL
jgi:hypothetical protein